MRKPTGLLAVRLRNFSKSMYSRTTPGATQPTEVAIGKDATGAFKTSAHKEHPPDFCCAIAGTISDQLERDLQSDAFRVQMPDGSLEQWIHEALQATANASAQTFLPDYQGR